MQLIKEQEWQALPEPAQQEVYEFFLFIKQRYTKPIEQAKKPRNFGQHRGLIESSKDFDEPLPDSFWLGKDYFDELLERIREIHASERRFYQKITDIYKEYSIDYSANGTQTQTFYQTVQNKLGWAITGKTAAEIFHDRANAELPNMGLQSFKNAPSGKVLKSDVSVANNDLIEKEIKELERNVSMYLDYAELQASRNIPMKMADWIEKLAHREYEKFRIVQDRNFDKSVKNLTTNK